MEKQGVFYAVSVGPGDPELLTRQACRVLEACDVIAAPRMKSGRMLALDIAAGAVDMPVSYTHLSLLFADTVGRIHCDNSKSGMHESIDFRDPPSERIDNSTKCDIIPLSGKI